MSGGLLALVDACIGTAEKTASAEVGCCCLLEESKRQGIKPFLGVLLQHLVENAVRLRSVAENSC